MTAIGAKARASLADLLGPRVAFDASLARHTSLGVGGPADALATPASVAELAALVSLCAAHELPLHVLGGGFNTLLLDGGIAGVVLRTQKLRGIDVDRSHVLRAEAGVSHSQVMRVCLERGLGGLEFAAGIPGSVGGWIAMNAGVPDREVGARVVDVEVATPSGLQTLDRDALRFVYRGALGLPPGGVVVAARFQLTPGVRETLRAEVDRHLAHRRATQPIDQPSCGSVFKNPPGEHAGRLIELAGLKGVTHGGAQISSVHANFIVNTGGARAADVLALIEQARDGVFARCGIALEPEVKIVGRASR